jgi:hypothetical protein
MRVLTGDLDGGLALLRQAVDEAERIGSPPFVARAKVGLARALRARSSGPADVDAAVSFAREAEALATSLGMARVAVRAAAAGALPPTD